MASKTMPRPGLVEHLRLASRASDMAWTLERMYERFGPVADVGYRIPFRVTYLMGTEANRTILADRPENFLWGEALRLLKVVNGPTALVLSDGDDHRRRRRLVQPAFTRRRVDAQLGLAVAEIDAVLDHWTPGRRFDAYSELREAVRRIAVRALFGEQLGDVADRIGEALEPALRYVGRTPLTRIDLDLPFLPYRGAVRARQAVDEIVRTEIARRRAEGVDADASPDTLSALLAAETDDALTDDEICDQVRSLIAAGYDTTSSSAAWIVHALGTEPQVLAALREQVRDTIGDRAPALDDLRAMPLVDGVVRETLRLRPPGVVSARIAIDDFEVYGHTVPAGSWVMYSPYITHRLPSWGDPERFRPDRWDADGSGEPEPYAYVPFGGGYRKCIGFALATLELQVLTTRLAQRTHWTLDDPDVQGAGIANYAPKGGLPITVVSG